MAYTVTFWGTRGSIPTPGPHTARYGGNTSCVAMEGPGGQLVILDAGTGIRGLGLTLLEQNGAVRAEILLSHTHWDHIQGLPYFKPFFAPGNTVRIWGSKQGTTSLDEILHLQMDPAVFPVPLTAVSATLSVEEVRAGVEFVVGPFQARAMQLRHPGTTLAYRLKPTAGGQSTAYVTDNELGPGGSYSTPGSWRRDLVQFLKGVDLLIHDAMYTPEELDTRRGWGHSSYEEAVELAAEAGARKLVLFHHEPEHDDGALDALHAAARRIAAQRGAPTDVIVAQEGMQLSL
jgi:phosphoribosyl 1,2-cyclic phosphodiesterase